MFDKFYNKWLSTGDKKSWSSIMDEKEKKRYRVTVRMLEKNNALDDCNDVPLGVGSGYEDSSIVRLEDGNAIVNVIGKLTIA